MLPYYRWETEAQKSSCLPIFTQEFLDVVRSEEAQKREGSTSLGSVGLSWAQRNLRLVSTEKQVAWGLEG